MCESITNDCKDRQGPDDDALEKALARAMKLCSRNEKCSFQVRRYLQEFSFALQNGRCKPGGTECGKSEGTTCGSGTTNIRRLDSEEIEQVLKRLEEEGFVDDRRFALAYARDRIRLSKWGGLKVRNYLMHFGIDSRLINDAIAQVPGSERRNNLHSLIHAKLNSLLKNVDMRSLDYEQKRKIYAKAYRYAIGCGYGCNEIMAELGTFFAPQDCAGL